MYTARTASALDTMPLMACRSPKLRNIRQLANGDGSMYNPPRCIPACVPANKNSFVDLGQKYSSSWWIGQQAFLR